MALEFVGIGIILALWIFEMNRNLSKDSTDKDYYKFLLAYIVGFAILAEYSVRINNMTLAFFFLLLAMVTLLEFAFVMVRRR